MGGFPKIGDPSIVPLIVGSLISGPQIRVPRFRKLPYCGIDSIDTIRGQTCAFRPPYSAVCMISALFPSSSYRFRV